MKAIIVFLTTGIVLWILQVHARSSRNRDGLQLIARAWVATYQERHLRIPPRGPRDGVSLEKSLPRSQKPFGSHENPMSIPGVLEVNSQGLQFAVSPPNPKARLLIVGASVAFAQYATTTDRTYFNQLSRHLMGKGHAIQILVLATRSWTSDQELAAFRNMGLSLKPDFVLFLDGLNDLTQYSQLPEQERVANYLQRMRTARDLAMANHIQVIFCPQPFLPQKKVKSPLEEAILRVYAGPFQSIGSLIADNQAMRQGLREMTVPNKVWVMDCSGVFDDETYTTFTDIWHFTDVGQAILGEFMAKKLAPFLSRR